MHIVLFRYSARVVKLEFLSNKNVVVLAPEAQKQKYDTYLSEGHSLPNVIFLKDFILPNIILEIRKINQNNIIESITTLSEEDIDIAGILNDHFVCKNTKAVSNLLFKDKYYMRSFLTGIVKQPNFRLLESKNDLDLFWNSCNTSIAVLKPKNLAGSLGVKKITQKDVIGPEYYTGNYIVEEYVSINKMITCDGYAMGNKIKRFYIHEYEELLLDSLSSSGYYLIRTSSLYDKQEDFIKIAYDNCSEVLNVFSVNDEVTPFHFEWFFDFSTKEIVFCEVGKRFGGADIPQLILDSFGVDILKEYWEILTDKNYQEKLDYLEEFSFPHTISATFSLYKDSGTVVKTPSKDQLKWANKVYIFVKPGDYSRKSINIVENSMLIQFNCKNDFEFNKRVAELREISNEFEYKKDYMQ